MFNLSLERLIYVLPAIIIALTFHEYAHAKVAYAFGDPTAKEAGRLTLNPFKHLDLMGTLLLVLAGFGWAKPVPINPMYFSGNRKGKILLVSLAGPLTNLAEALVATGILALIWHFVPYGSVSNYLFNLLYYFMFINIVLAIFNFIPIPPLDGSKILAGLLPDKCFNFILGLERYGFLILLVLVFIPEIMGLFGLPTIDILGLLITKPANFIAGMLLKLISL